MERLQSTKAIEKYKQKSKNANTTKATTQWMRVFCQWAQKRDHPKNIEVLSPDTLAFYNTSLQKLIKKIAKIMNLLFWRQCKVELTDIYVKSNYEYSILNSRFFKGSRDVLDGKTRLLRVKGLGKKPNKTNSLTRQEKDIMRECGQLGDKTPESTIATLWWKLTQHFWLQGRREHQSMRVEDFSFRKYETGASYKVYAEGITKTRQSGLHQQSRLQLPKMFEHSLKGVL